MPIVKKSIDVNAPLDRVYEEWTNFEKFPRFMENVKEVRRAGPEKTHWVVEAAGQTVEWDAKTEVQDRERVSWTAEGEAKQHGVVTFEDLGANRTRVNVNIDYELASDLKETGAKWFGVDDNIVENDLHRFKEALETGHGNAPGGTGG